MANAPLELDGLGLLAVGQPVQIFGDLELIVRFLTKEYRAKRPELARMVEEAHTWLSKLTSQKVVVGHVLRENNTVADWLAGAAGRLKGSYNWRPLLPNLESGGKLPCLADLMAPGSVVTWKLGGKVPTEVMDWWSGHGFLLDALGVAL